MPRGQVHECIVVAVGDVIEVLNADDRGDRLRLGELVRGDRTEAEVPDQPLLPQFGERLELRRDRARLGCVGAADAQVHHVQHVEFEVPQVVVDLFAQLRRCTGVRPAALLVAAGADLRDDRDSPVPSLGYALSSLEPTLSHAPGMVHNSGGGRGGAPWSCWSGRRSWRR